MLRDHSGIKLSRNDMQRRTCSVKQRNYDENQ